MSTNLKTIVIGILILFLFSSNLFSADPPKSFTEIMKIYSAEKENKLTGKSFLISPMVLPVNEGGSKSFSIKLTEEPSSDITGEIIKIQGDDDFTIDSGATFSIPKADWNTPISVTISTPEDDDFVNGYIVYEIRETSGEGIVGERILVYEIDNDNIIEVGGTISQDTTWEYTGQNYKITSKIIIPEGVTLTINPYINIIAQNYQYYAFEVNGTLKSTENLFLIDTYVPHTWYPFQKKDGIIFKGNGVGIFHSSTILTEEKSPDSGGYYSYWSSALIASDTSDLTLKGCVFESLNLTQGYRTIYGVLVYTGAKAVIDSHDIPYYIQPTFRGFRTAVYLEFGEKSQDIYNCKISNCDRPIVLSGNITTQKNLHKNIYQLTGDVVVKSGGTLIFEPETYFYNSPSMYKLIAESGGTIQASQNEFKFDTNAPHEWYIYDRRNGIEFQDGSTGNFENCSFKTTEKNENSNRVYDHWSAVLVGYGTANLTIKGCSFESLNDVNNYRTVFAITIEGGTNVSIGDSTNKKSTIPTSFKGFHTAINWQFGSGIQNIYKCQFTDCGKSFRIFSDIVNEKILYENSYEMASDVNVKSGGKLILKPTSSLFNSDSKYKLIVEDGGVIEADQAQFLFNTIAPHEWYVGNRRNGIELKGKGTGTFDKCIFKTSEKDENSNRYYDHWSAAIVAYNNSDLTIKGCNFESLNDTNNYKTVFGIIFEGDAKINIGDAIAYLGKDQISLKTTIKGFRCGINWSLGKGQQDVAICNFDNCDINCRFGGDLYTPVQFVNKNMQMAWNTNIKSGGKITFSPTSNLNAPFRDVWLNVETGGELIFDQSFAEMYSQISINSGSFSANYSFFSFNTYVPHEWYPSHKRNGMDIYGTGNAEFKNCTIILAEYSPEAYRTNTWSAGMYLYEQGSLLIDGCYLTSIPSTSSYYTTYGIISTTTGGLTVKNTGIINNKYGMYITSAFPGTVYVHNNDFHGNINYAIINDTGFNLDAIQNWWGSINGPSHQSNPGGSGDRVSDYVLYGNNLLTPPLPVVKIMNPITGQEINNLTGAAEQSNVELLGFRINPFSLYSQIYQIAFRIYDNVNLTLSDISDFQLRIDSNGNGTIDANETMTVGGIAQISVVNSELIVKFNEPFANQNNAEFILLANIQNLQEGSRFSIGINKANLLSMPGIIFEQYLSDTTHFISSQSIILSDHIIGQETDNFNGLMTQANIDLFAFRLISNSNQIDEIKFTLSDIIGITNNSISKAVIYKDLNQNGKIDANENPVSNDAVVNITNNVGYIQFTENFEANGNYILNCDFKNLAGGNKISCVLNSSDIIGKDNSSVFGSTQKATHIVKSPYEILESDYWTQKDLFSSQLIENVQLLGFKLLPQSGVFNSLKIKLYGAIGITSLDITNVKVYWDSNANGLIDSGDEIVLQNGIVSLDNYGNGFIFFNTPFNKTGDLIVIADIYDLSDNDEISVTVEASDISVPEGYFVIGAGPYVRHIVKNGMDDGSSNRQNWTLTYRSPGGTTVNGRFNNAGDKIILGYDTGSAYIYSVESNTPLLMLKDHYDKVEYSGFSSDDSAAVTVTRDGAVSIWDANTGSKLSSMFSDLLVTSAVPSPDFKKLLVITEGKGLLLDIDLKERLWEFIPGDATVNSIAYSPDGTMILIGSSDKRAYLIDSATGVEIRRFIGHSQAVTAVGFTGDGSHLFTSSSDATVQLWKTIGGPPLSTISLQGQTSQGAAVSFDGKRVALVTGTGNSALLRIFDENALELFSININNKSGGRWGGTLETLTFNKQGDLVLITSASDFGKVACFKTSNGDFVRSWGPLGSFSSNNDYRPRISEDGDRIFYMGNWGLNLLFRTMEKEIIMSPRLNYSKGFSITDDGRKVAWFDSNYLYIDEVFDWGFVPFLTKNTGISYNALTMSSQGSKVIAGDRLLSAVSGNVFANYGFPDAEYRSAFSPDGTLWGFARPNDKAIITCRTADPKATLYNMMLTDPYTPYKIFYHPDGKRVACVDANTGVQMYDMETYLPVGLYRFADNSDAALSKDGTLLLIGANNNVRLIDVRTGRILRYFYPQHSSIQNVGVRAVQFAKNDTLIMIAWSYNYIETYERTQPKEIKISPDYRRLAPGESQAFKVEVVYDDTTVEDITPNPDSKRKTAVLEIEPLNKASVTGNIVTVPDNAFMGGSFIVRAKYRENRTNYIAEAIINVRKSFITDLIPNPDHMTVTQGVFRPITYTARYDDGYSEDVTSKVNISSDHTEDVIISGNAVKVLFTAVPGDILISGSLKDKYGNTHLAKTIVTTFGAKTEWERYRITGGGYGMSGAFSPDKKYFAAGSSSGAINIYKVGATPSQYQMERIIEAHIGQIIYLNYINDNKIISVSDEGTIKIWDLSVSYTAPATIFYHDSPITAAMLLGTNLAFGDSVGKVGLYNISNNTAKWVVSAHQDSVKSVALDSSLVISGGKDNRAKVFNIVSGQIVKNILSHTKPVISVGFVGTTAFYTISEDQTFVFWNKSNYDVVERYEFDSKPTVAENIGGYIYVSTIDPVSTWVYNSDRLLLRWLEHPPNNGEIVKYLIDPSGKYILTGRRSSAKTEETMFGSSTSLNKFSSYQFWEVGRGIYRGSLAHSFPMADAHVTNDASKIFTQCEKRTKEWIFDVADSTIIQEKQIMETGYFLNKFFKTMDFKEDSSLFATRVDVSIYMYDTINELLWKTLHVPGEGPFTISPNGNFMATADTKTRLWDLANLSQIREESRLCNSLDFRLNDNFLGSISADKFVGIWNKNGYMFNGIQTTYTPIKIIVNSTGDRTAVVTFYAKDSLFKITYYYYLEIFDTSDISIEPPLINKIFILSKTVDAFFGGDASIGFTIDVSDDTALALVGTDDNRPVKLLNINDGSTIREFSRPSGVDYINIGAAKVQFTDNDDSVMIAWGEGFAELYRRVRPQELSLSVASTKKISRRDMDINDIKKISDKIKADGGIATASPGDILQTFALAKYANGSELNVTSSVNLSVTPKNIITIDGTRLIVNANAEETTVTITATFDELDINLKASVQVAIQIPSIRILKPASIKEPALKSYQISWVDNIPDVDAQISLYYDTDTTGTNGVLIASGISEDNETDSLNWNTTNIPEGVYYIYAKLEDGINPPIYSYSKGTVKVTHITKNEIKEHLLNKTVLPENRIIYADLNADNKVDIADLILAIKNGM